MEESNVGRNWRKLEEVKICEKFSGQRKTWEFFTTEYADSTHGQSPLGFPRNAVFSRYTRYTATTRVNIDDV